MLLASQAPIQNWDSVTCSQQVTLTGPPSIHPSLSIQRMRLLRKLNSKFKHFKYFWKKSWVIYDPFCILRKFRVIWIICLSLNSFSYFNLKRYSGQSKWHGIFSEYTTNHIWLTAIFSIFLKCLNFEFIFLGNLIHWMDKEGWIEGI